MSAATICAEGLQARCPHCGRTVKTFERDGAAVMFGHRTEYPHTPETPWCKGGGERV